ncbi:uracil-DNA glycosylase-like protein [Melampsora americana]|nr:uracil-DNA glycosylase-like protein [Melampsora americana]
MIYNWSHLTPLDQVKVIILGNHPTPKPDYSHGLAYSQSIQTSKLSGTMNNIHQKIFNEFSIDQHFQIPSHGSLVSWAKSGVLLFNIIQTICKSPGTSHHQIGWERFTISVLNLIDQEGGSSFQDGLIKKGLVFLVWGDLALKHINQSLIPTSNRNHLILKSQHPQPSTAHLGFFESNHQFNLTNEFLKNHYGINSIINWCQLEKIDPIDVLKRN